MIDSVSSSISPWWQWQQTQQAGSTGTAGAGTGPNSSAFSLASFAGGTDTTPSSGPASPGLQLPTNLFLMLQSGTVDGTSGTTSDPTSSSSGGTSTGTTGPSLGDLFSQLQSLLDNIENDLSTGAAADASDPLPQANGASDPTRQSTVTPHHHHHHSASGSDPTGTASDQSAASALTGTQSS
jgi:hypothetical protein